jgi:hypothetical protein
MPPILEGVHVEVGPVRSFSVLSWVAYAHATLDRNEGELPEDVITGFRAMLVVEYLVHAFYRIAQRLADEAELRGHPLAPADSDEFYWALVRSLLSALTDGGGSAGEFAEHLRAFWPGLTPDV